jgi:hypothetical protein
MTFKECELRLQDEQAQFILKVLMRETPLLNGNA